jgi:hypothetical protein
MGKFFPPALPHGPIEEVFPDIFVVRGTARFGPFFTITRNMTVVRQGKELTIVSAVRLNRKTEAELDALGDIQHLVKIGNFHGSDDPYYKTRYRPVIWAAPGADHKGGLAADRELRPGGELPIEGASLFAFESSTKPEAAILIPREGGVLLTCDSVQNWGDFAGCSLLGRFMLRRMGFGGAARIGPGWRKRCESKEGPSFAGDFERMLELPFKHILSAHGYPLKDTAKDDLRAMVKSTYPEAKVG